MESKSVVVTFDRDQKVTFKDADFSFGANGLLNITVGQADADGQIEIIASFAPGCWSAVWFKDALA